VVLILVGALAILLGLRFTGAMRAMVDRMEGRTAISQELVVERIRTVAKIVSTEMTIGDVVTYENTFYGSTKRALIVVSAKVLAGIDLEAGSDVRIDSGRRHITITIPEARVLAVDIIRLQTYDEERGLWNPFRPADRDSIYQRIRRQLFTTAEGMGIVQRANQSAAMMLETMFTVDGYTAEVRFGSPGEPSTLDTGPALGARPSTALDGHHDLVGAVVGRVELDVRSPVGGGRHYRRD
jgi:hypothetical protein